jgi:hypothetical protein
MSRPRSVIALLAMNQLDLGFRTDQVLTMRVPLVEARYPNREPAGVRRRDRVILLV